MALRFNSIDIFYDELKRKLALKNTLILDLKNILMFYRTEPHLIEFLISNIQNGDDIVKENSLISVYLLLNDFQTNCNISSEEQQMLENLIIMSKLNLTLNDIFKKVEEESYE